MPSEFFIKLFTKKNDNILDPFAGSGSTAVAGESLNRNVVLIDNKKEYIEAIKKRLEKTKSESYRHFFLSKVATSKSNLSLSIKENKRLTKLLLK